MRLELKSGLAAALAGLLALSGFSSQNSTRAAASRADIVIDAAARFQTLQGWEVTTRGWDLNKGEDRFDPSYAENMEEVVSVLVDQAGINRLRLEMRSNAESPVDHWKGFSKGEVTHTSWAAHMYENVNDNRDPFVADPGGFQWSELDYRVENVVLPMRDALAARGERLFVNLCVVDFAKGEPGSLDLAAKPEEYAELVSAAFDHLSGKYSLTPDAFEIVLEPENSGSWRAERIGPAIKAAAKRLQSKGFDPQIIAPSTKLARNAVPYFSAARRAGAKIDVISYHSYDRPGDGVRRAIAWLAKSAGVSTAMLEHLRADVHEFHRDMTVANVSSWQQWAIAHFKDSGNYLLVADLSRPKGERIRLASRTRMLGQIWRHARIGDVRVGAVSASPALKPLAFVRPDGGAILAVIADRPGDFSIEGLPGGVYEIERTTAQSFAEEGGFLTVGANGRATLSMPSPGVIAVAAKTLR